METKRVVFVSLKPSSTASDDQHASRNARRKRALGIEERATWEEFVSAACARLQIAGARAVYHASTGERVHGIEDVQDIEDLIVEEDESARMMESGATPGVSPLRTPNGRANGANARGTPGRDHDGDYDDDDGKNKPRRMSVLLSSLIPGLGSAVGDGALRKLDSALDAAERGDDDDGRSKNHRVPTRKPVGARKTLKRKKRLNRRAAALLLIVFVGTLVYVFGRRFEDAPF